MTTDRIATMLTLLCGLATAVAGLVTLVTQPTALLNGNPLAWAVGFPELAAGLVCALWSRQQLQK
jgi:hypothetical protein